MENEDYTYVGGHGDYAGNILLDPDGLVTRTELYEAIAEMNTRTTAVIDDPEWAAGAVFSAIGLEAVMAVCLIAIATRAFANRGSRK